MLQRVLRRFKGPVLGTALGAAVLLAAPSTGASILQGTEPTTASVATNSVAPRTYFGDPHDFIPRGTRVAIIRGPEVRQSVGATGGLIHGTALRAQRTYPGSRIIPHNVLDGNPGVLAGFDAVVVVTHGTPNGSMWGADRIDDPNTGAQRPLPGYEILDGRTLGHKLAIAGFGGGHILLDSCNGGTESRSGALGTSTAQQVADQTGASVLAARADERYLEYAIADKPCFESIGPGRTVGPEDLGLLVVDRGRSRVLLELTRNKLGLDLSARYLGGFVANDKIGTVLQMGDLNSDLNPDGTAFELRVLNGTWAVFGPR